MASQLRFEGGELEELLERVRREVGPDARIVAANRIRQGGVAGFFAREGYEVVVDADTAPGTGRGTRGRRRGRGAVTNEATPTSEAWTPSTTANPTPPPSPAAASVLDLVEEVNEIERDQVIDLSDPPRPTLSTEATDFGTMLANLTRELDEEEASMPSTTVNDGPISPSAHYRRVTADPAAPGVNPAAGSFAPRTTAPGTTAPGTTAPGTTAPGTPVLPQGDARLLALGPSARARTFDGSDR